MSARPNTPNVARIHPYVSAAIRDRLTQHCIATRTTESAVVAQALSQYLDNTSDFALLLRRLDRLSRGLDRAERDIDLLSQAFGLFVRLWLAHTPRLPADARQAAQSSAEARYRQFLDRVAELVASGKRFVDDLPQDQIADRAELQAIASDTAAAGSPVADSVSRES